MDGWIDPATEAVFSAAIEPRIDITLHGSRDAELPESSLATDSELPAPVPIESDWAPIMEFTSADIFQHSPFGDILNSLPHCRDGDDLALPPNSTPEATPASAPTLSSETTAPIKDGWLDTA